LRAAEELKAGRVHAILIGGVDTYYDPLVVEELLAEERIFDGENTDCFLGGEGAAFTLLAPKSLARQMGWTTLAWLEGAATNGEPGNASNDVPCMGLGLSRVARACTERLVAEGRKVDWWISDLTPEESRGHELQLAWPRAAYEVMDEHSFLDVLPEHLGDLGAATMPTALAIAAEGLRRGDPAGDTCLFTASSNNEDRAAVLVAGQGTR
jgi:3-oxoacyl-[acyl-carrier-protein] synthase-1